MCVVAVPDIIEGDPVAESVFNFRGKHKGMVVLKIHKFQGGFRPGGSIGAGSIVVGKNTLPFADALPISRPRTSLYLSKVYLVPSWVVTLNPSKPAAVVKHSIRQFLVVVLGVETSL